MQTKPLLVGESNPYGSDPCYALYPAPDGCSGHRLAVLILGMSRQSYLESFDRINLVSGPWRIREARESASTLIGRRLILLGAKVCSAFGVAFTPFMVGDAGLVLPHPSGLNRMWQEKGSVERARKAVRLFCNLPPDSPPG